MKHVQLLCLLSALGISAFCLADDAVKDDEGFVSLFNGKDFSGWVSMGKMEGYSISKRT